MRTTRHGENMRSNAIGDEPSVGLITVIAAAALAVCACSPAAGAGPSLIADPANGGSGAPPGAGTSDFDRGVAYVEKQAYAEAILHFDRVLEVQPDNAEAHYFRALALLKSDKPAEAEPGLVKAIELDGNLTHARVHLGAIYLADPPRPDKAIAVLEPAMAKEPKAVDIRDLLAFAYRLTGKNDKAAEQYDKALAIKPTPQLHFAYSDLLFEMNKHAEATTHLKKALPAFKKDAKQLAGIGERFRHLKAFDDCVAAFDDALALDASNAGPYVLRGLCKHALHKEADAQEDYRRALKIDAKFQPAYFYLGVSFLDSNMRGKGVEQLEKAVKIDASTAMGKAAQQKLAELKKGK